MYLARLLGGEGGQSGLATFATEDIERAVGENSYLRGQDYFRRGMVRSVRFGGPGRIHGEVSGIRKEIDVVRRYRDEAGYTFFVLRRADGRARVAGDNGSGSASR